jgi:hypothetical protein
MRKAITIAICVVSIALLLQALLHNGFPGRSVEWIPLAFTALALRVGTRMVGRRKKAAAAEKSVAPIRLKA